MTQHNARLMTAPTLQQIVALTDDISQHTQEIADALADYETASELPSSEQAEARQDARDTIWSSWGDLETTTAELIALRHKLADTIGDE